MKNYLILLFFLIINSYSLQAKVSIDFFVPSGATSEVSRLYREFINDFMKSNKDIEVKLNAASSYNAILKEVFTLNDNKKGWIAVVEISELLTLKNKGALLELDALVEESQYLDNFLPAFLGNSYGDDKKIYGLPLFRSTPIVYYNLDILESAGIKQSDLPKTWSELEAMLEKIKKKTNKPPFGLASTWFDWLFESFVVQNGGSLANSTNTKLLFDSTPVIGALEYWTKLQKKGLLERVKGSWKGAINGFARGMYPCVYYSTGGMSFTEKTAKFKWLTTIMPGNPKFATSVGGGNLFISAHVSNEEKSAAWKFVKFLLQPLNQAKLSLKTGYFPVVKEAFNHELIKEKYSNNPSYVNAKKQLEFARPKIMTKKFNELRTVLKEAIDNSLDKNVPPEKTLKKAQEKGEKIIGG